MIECDAREALRPDLHNAGMYSHLDEIQHSSIPGNHTAPDLSRFRESALLSKIGFWAPLVADMQDSDTASCNSDWRYCSSDGEEK